MDIFTEVQHLDINAKICNIIKRNIDNPNSIPLDTFICILKNQELFEHMSKYKEFKYYYSYDLVSQKFTEGNVLIYLPNMKLYQLFDNVGKYNNYIQHMSDYQEQNLFQRIINVVPNYSIKTPRHDILDEIKQKLENIEQYIMKVPNKCDQFIIINGNNNTINHSVVSK